MALLVGIAGEAAGALAAHDHAAAVGSDWVVGPEWSGEPTDALPANVAKLAAREQPDTQ